MWEKNKNLINNKVSKVVSKKRNEVKWYANISKNEINIRKIASLKVKLIFSVPKIVSKKLVFKNIDWNIDPPEKDTANNLTCTNENNCNL